MLDKECVSAWVRKTFVQSVQRATFQTEHPAALPHPAAHHEEDGRSSWKCVVIEALSAGAYQQHGNTGVHLLRTDSAVELVQPLAHGVELL